MKAVNLGLSVMWGDCNIGAKECYDEGNLYTWDEIISINTSTCNLAEKMYGSGWQIPTKEHIIELMQNCEFEIIQLLTKKFLLKVTGPNGNSIYLPLAGNKDWKGNKVKGGFYWTSTKAVEEDNHAYQLRIADQIIWGYNHIKVYQSVRPIYCPIQDNKVNYNKVDSPINYSEANLNYITMQIKKWCNKLNIPFSLSELQKVNSYIRNKIPTAEYTRLFQLRKGNALGHGNITFIYSLNQRLVGLLIEEASKEYIDSVKNCGMVYGVVLGIGSITYGADLRLDTIVKLKPDDIYVRLY